MCQSQDKYKCKQSGILCDVCRYDYCIDGCDMDDAMQVIAEYKNQEDIKKLSSYQMYYRQNQNRLKEKSKKYYETHKDRAKEYRKKNIEKIRAYQREYRKANITPEKREEENRKAREYYKEHREEIKARNLARYHHQKVAANG